MKSRPSRRDECGGLIIVGVAVSVWADFLRGLTVVVGLAAVWGVVFASAAVGVLAVLGACGVTWIKSRPLDVAVRVWIDSIAWSSRRCDLKIPRAPSGHFVGGDTLVEG